MLNKIENKYGRYLKHEILRRNLENWQKEAGINALQKHLRAEATTPIISAYTNNSKHLKLYPLGLTSLPKGAFQYLPNLESLNLDNNYLSTIPSETFNQLTIDITFSDAPKVVHTNVSERSRKRESGKIHKNR